MRSQWILTVSLALSMLPLSAARAEKPFEGYTTQTVSANDSSYVAGGSTYTYGSGNDLELTTITAGGGQVYYPVSVADQVFIRREDNAQVSDERCNFFVERGSNSFDAVSSFPADNNGNCSLETLWGGLIVNRGLLDPLSNDPPSSTERPNNIERVDFVYTSGITAPSSSALLNEAGHIVMEKNGNNPVKAAAILGVDAVGNPTQFGAPVTIDVADYGKPNPGLQWNFLTDSSTTGPVTNPEYFANKSEPIGGTLVTLQDFGITASQTYYGFAVFGTDVPDNADLTDTASFPDDTPDGSGNTGGADIHGGMGGYWSALSSSAQVSFPTNGLPDSSPPPPTSLSCHNAIFSDFVPNQAHFGTTSGGRKKYSIDTEWTAIAPDGTMATLKTVRIDNISGDFVSTGSDPDVFFLDYTDPITGFSAPKLTEREGQPGDAWVLEVEYSRPIGSGRVLVGDVDSQKPNSNIQFKDVITVEGFLDVTSISPTDTYRGSILVESVSGNRHTFSDDPTSTGGAPPNPNGLGPNPKEDQTSNRIVVDYENTFVDSIQITYGVGESLDGGATQSVFMTSGMAAGCRLRGVAFEDQTANDMLNTAEIGLGNVAVTLYKDDGDDIFEPNGDDLLIETQDTVGSGAYLFTNLAENQIYWVHVDTADTDLGGRLYGGGDVDNTQTDPRRVALFTNDLASVNFPFDAFLKAQMALVKRITAINRGKTNEQLFDNTYVDVGTNNDDDNASEWPANYLSGVVDGINVQSGDEIEYTIYFLSNGDATAEDFRLCDRIPDYLTFVDNVFNPNEGILLGLASGNSNLTNAEDTDPGAYISSNSDSLTYCRQDLSGGAQTQDNGFIVVNVGDVPAAANNPTGAYGFVRFRAQVQ